MIALLAGLLWFPHFGGTAEVAHDLGIAPDLKGVIAFELAMGVVSGPKWQLEVSAGNRTYVRENRRNETMFRISPEQVHYPVGIRLRFPMTSPKREWTLFARHQSNHDIDTNDPVLNRETISYEVYGAQLLGPNYTLEAGVYYDRGTRLDETQQNWPFDYFLGGLRATLEWSPGQTWYTGLDITVVGHGNANSQLPHVDIGGHLDLGRQFPGKGARGRTFLRILRINNYQYLGDEPRHLILVGFGVDGLSTSGHPH